MGVGEGANEIPDQLLEQLRKRAIYYKSQMPQKLKVYHYSKKRKLRRMMDVYKIYLQTGFLFYFDRRAEHLYVVANFVLDVIS